MNKPRSGMGPSAEDREHDRSSRKPRGMKEREGSDTSSPRAWRVGCPESSKRTLTD